MWEGAEPAQRTVAIGLNFCYVTAMSKLETLVARVSALPQQRQDELAEALTLIVDLAAPVADVPGWHLAELKSRLEGPDDFATDEEVAAFFAGPRV